MATPYSTNSVSSTGGGGGGGGNAASVGAANDIQISDGAGGFSNNSGDTATSSSYTINSTTLVADRAKSIIGINKTPADYALEIDGSGRPVGATLSMTNGATNVLYDNNGLQTTADVQLVGSDFTGSFSNINIGNAIRSDYANKNVKIGDTTSVADAQCNLEVLDDTAEIRVHGSVGQKLTYFHTTGGTTYDLAEIPSAYASASDGSFLYFRTRVAGSINNRMIINDEGNVGINQNAPTEKLHVGTSTDTDSVILVESVDGSVKVGRDAGSHFGQSNSKTVEFTGVGTIGTKSNHKLVVGTNNNPRLTVLSGGNVGINETAPSYQLEVGGDAACENLNVSSAHTDLGLMSSSTITIDALNYTYRSYIVSTNSNNITALSLSNFNVNTQVVVFIYATGSGATLNGFTSTLTGAKSAHDDITLSLADVAILTLTYDGTNYYAAASKFQ